MFTPAPSELVNRPISFYGDNSPASLALTSLQLAEHAANTTTAAWSRYATAGMAGLVGLATIMNPSDYAALPHSTASHLYGIVRVSRDFYRLTGYPTEGNADGVRQAFAPAIVRDLSEMGFAVDRWVEASVQSQAREGATIDDIRTLARLYAGGFADALLTMEAEEGYEVEEGRAPNPLLSSRFRDYYSDTMIRALAGLFGEQRVS